MIFWAEFSILFLSFATGWGLRILLAYSLRLSNADLVSLGPEEIFSENKSKKKFTQVSTSDSVGYLLKKLDVDNTQILTFLSSQTANWALSRPHFGVKTVRVALINKFIQF